jgi:hypothetical protein
MLILKYLNRFFGKPIILQIMLPSNCQFNCSSAKVQSKRQSGNSFANLYCGLKSKNYVSINIKTVKEKVQHQEVGQ